MPLNWQNTNSKLNDYPQAIVLIYFQALTVFESNGRYESARASIANTRVARLFRYYAPLSHQDEAAIWRKQKELQTTKDAEPMLVPDEQRVEDAGLELEAVLESK